MSDNHKLPPSLRYRIRAYWNSTQVLEAACTAAMACDIASEFLRGNFAGSFAKRTIEAQLANLLDRITDGQSVRLGFDDSTGAACVSIWRHYETAEQVQPA